MCFVSVDGICPIRPNRYNCAIENMYTIFVIKVKPLNDLGRIWNERQTTETRTMERLMDDERTGLYKSQVWLMYVAGRDGAWDKADEDQNNVVKELGPTSPDDINKQVWIANGLHAMDEPTRKMPGVERYKNDDYSRVKQKHVDLIVNVFKEKLGESITNLFQRKKGNPFSRTSKQPWKDVVNAAKTRREYIQNYFENHASPFDG